MPQPYTRLMEAVIQLGRRAGGNVRPTTLSSFRDAAMHISEDYPELAPAFERYTSERIGYEVYDDQHEVLRDFAQSPHFQSLVGEPAGLFARQNVPTYERRAARISPEADIAPSAPPPSLAEPQANLPTMQGEGRAAELAESFGPSDPADRRYFNASVQHKRGFSSSDSSPTVAAS